MWLGMSGRTTVLSFPGARWGAGRGIRRLELRLRHDADPSLLRVSLQHPGRMLAPEAGDSTISLQSNINTILTVRLGPHSLPVFSGILSLSSCVLPGTPSSR